MNKPEDQNEEAFQLCDPTVTSLESVETPEEQNTQTSQPCEQTVKNRDSMETSKNQNVQTWSDYWQTLTLRARSWRASASEELHPCLLIPLLTLMDVLYWCLASLLVIGGLVLFLAACSIAVSCMIILMAPCFGVFYWVLQNVTPQSGSFLEFSTPLVLRQISCVLATVLLYYIMDTLLGWEAYYPNIMESLPIVPRILAYFAWYLAFSAFCGLSLCTMFLLFYYFCDILYCLYLFCYWVTRYVPWYVLLVTVILVPLCICNLLHQIDSYKPIDRKDNLEVKAYPRPPV